MRRTGPFGLPFDTPAATQDKAQDSPFGKPDHLRLHWQYCHKQEPSFFLGMALSSCANAIQRWIFLSQEELGDPSLISNF